jgi:hypothetical protein
MPAGLHLPFVAFFGRTLAEYLEMFAITVDELRGGTTLDCPSGPDSFVAEACALGCAVSGIDPMYAHAPAELSVRARENLDQSFAHIDAQRDRLSFRDYAAFRRAKYDALDAFLRDYAANRARYTAASLPALPFVGTRSRHAIVWQSSRRNPNVRPVQTTSARSRCRRQSARFRSRRRLRQRHAHLAHEQ